jgi:transcriptional regulator with XRE-family HTH domain
MQKQLPPNRLRALREERGLKLVHLAVLCDVDVSTISRWENGEIPQKYLAVLAAKFDVDVPYIAGWTQTAAKVA